MSDAQELHKWTYRGRKEYLGGHRGRLEDLETAPRGEVRGLGHCGWADGVGRVKAAWVGAAQPRSRGVDLNAYTVSAWKAEPLMNRGSLISAA